MKAEQLDKIFFSLSDKNRRQILSLLMSDDLSVGLIAERTELSMASASKHIQVLLQCGLINQIKLGKKKVCKANLVTLYDANLWISSIGMLDSLDMSGLEAFLSHEKIL